MKKILVSFGLALLIAACILTVYAADGMTFCSAADTVKGTCTAYRLDDGSSHTFDYTVPEDGVTLLLFYGNTCPNSQEVIRSLAQSEWAEDSRINLIAVESQSGTHAETRSFFQTYAGENASAFTVWYNNSSLIWNYGSLVMHNTLIEYPLVVAVKEDSRGPYLRAASMGYQAVSVFDAAIELLLNEDLELPPAELNYTTENGEVTITGFSDPSTAPSELVIPSHIDGMPVTRIGDYSFDYSSITSVTLPDTVTYIGFGAFMYNYYLSQVTLSNSLTEIYYSAFNNCDRLTQIILPDSLVTLYESAFYDCDGLTEITLPASLTTLGDRVFYDCDKLATVQVAEGNTAFKAVDNILYSADGSELIFYPSTKDDPHFAIPEGVTSVHPYAMSFCAFETLTLPNSLEVFSRASLYAPSKLHTYIVADDHPTLAVRDGILYSKDFSTLVACPTAFSGVLVVPEGVVTIAGEAFANCANLTHVTLPTSLRKISDRAFAECFRMISLEIPEGLTHVGNSAFYATQGLTELVLPASLEFLGTYCFNHSWVSELYFQGDAPTVDRYLQYQKNIYTVYRTESSTGWDDPFWSNYTLEFWDGTNLPMLSGTGSDYDGNSYSWSYDRNTATLTLSGYAFRSPINYRSSAWKGYAGRIRHVVLENTVELERNLLGYYPALESVSLPATLSTIVDTTFNGAQRPIALTLDEGNPYFTMKDGLLYNKEKTRLVYAGAMEGVTSFTVPSTVTHIDYYAFLNAGVTDMVLPSALASTEAYHKPTFALRAPALERVSISGSSLFYSEDGILYRSDKPWIVFCPNGRTGSFTIPEHVVEIDDYAFAYSSLEEVIFPSGIGLMSSAFYGAKVKRVHLTGNLGGIAEWAFAASEIEEFVMEDSYCIYVGDLAFQDCKKLERVVLDGVLSTGDGLFSGCSALRDVILSDRMTTLSYNTFGYCTSLTSITLPESITVVEEDAFRDCVNLERIYVPGAPPSFLDGTFTELGITPLMLVDLSSDNWRLLEGSIWGGCLVTDWEKPESVSAEWVGDELTIALRGVSRADPMLVAFYNEHGRMVDCRLLPMKAGNQTLAVPGDVTEVSVFCLDRTYKLTLPALSPKRM